MHDVEETDAAWRPRAGLSVFPDHSAAAPKAKTKQHPKVEFATKPDHKKTEDGVSLRDTVKAVAQENASDRESVLSKDSLLEGQHLLPKGAYDSKHHHHELTCVQSSRLFPISNRADQPDQVVMAFYADHASETKETKISKPSCLNPQLVQITQKAQHGDPDFFHRFPFLTQLPN